MVYSDFTLDMVIDKFELELHDRPHLLRETPPKPPSEFLEKFLAETVPLALASNSEKARSELIITPILLEFWRQQQQQIGLFSGINFTVEPSLGLTGICDFLVTRSPELMIIKSPVIVVVEAKKENLHGGIGQCAAEMVAAQIFNAKHNQPDQIIWGCVTSGTNWRFMYLQGKQITLDLDEYYANEVDKILGILHQSVN